MLQTALYLFVISSICGCTSGEIQPLSPANPINLLLALPSHKYSIDAMKNYRNLSLEVVRPCVDIALEDVYNNMSLLHERSLNVIEIDTELNLPRGMNQLIHVYANVQHLGDSSCSDVTGRHDVTDHRQRRPVNMTLIGFASNYLLDMCAKLIHEWDTGVPLLTTIGQVEQMQDRKTYPNLIRVGSALYNELANNVVDVMGSMGFTKAIPAFFIYDPSMVLGSKRNSGERSECYFMLLPIKRLIDKRLNTLTKDNHAFLSTNKTSNESLYLADISQQLKILSIKSNMIILCASPDTVRDIMLAAHDLKMAQSGEYVFINIDVSTGSHAAQPWFRPNDTENNDKAREAYQALKTISLRRSNVDAYNNFEQRVKQQAEDKYSYSAKMGQAYQMNNFISAFYDAVLLYAIALNETLTEGGDPRNGTEITRRMWNRTFEGIAGNVSIDDNGDRYSDYSLLDLDPQANEFKEVAYYSGTKKQLIPMGDYHWVKGQPPKDTPVCGYDRSLCPEGLPTWAWSLIGLAIVTLVFSIGSFFIYRHYRLEAELAAMTWRIRWEELTGEERRKERRKNKDRGTGWLLDDADQPKDSIEQTNPLLERESHGSDQRDQSAGYHSSASRKLSHFIESRFRSRKGTDGSNIDKINNDKNQTGGGGGTGGTGKRSETSLGENMAHDAKSKSSKNSFLSRSSARKPVIHEEMDYCDEVDELMAKDSGNGSDKPMAIALVESDRGSAKNRRDSWVSLKSVTSEETINFDPTSQIFTRTAVYRGTLCAVKKLSISKQKIELNRQMLLELKKMKDLANDYVTRFVGACVDPPHYCTVTEYCSKGSLEDILENENFELDKMMKQSMIHDLVKGMDFIHASDVRSHGNLKSSNCVVDSRFVLKVTDFGLHSLHSLEEPDENELEDSHAFWKRMMWTAPEILRKTGMRPIRDGGTQKGDVYSFAIVLHEMLYRKGVWYLENQTKEPREVIVRVCASTDVEELFRPSVLENCGGEEDAAEVLVRLMERCWVENPAQRPDFPQIRKTIRLINKENETSNIVDNLLKRMEQYANNLEQLVDERTSDYLEEKHKVENLLHQLLPPSVAETLIRGEPVKAETFEEVTIYFSDIVGFTALSSSSTPMEVVHLLNDLYTAFDATIADFDVYKVETIGDAYMVVSGLPERIGERHASEIARMSLALLNRIKTFRIRHRPNEQLKLRIGLHSGSVCAGVVGQKMPRYCLFGDTVNTASRMESNGLPLRIHVSSDTKAVLDKDPLFVLDLRGEVEMKGKGVQTTWWLRAHGDVHVPDFPGIA